MGSKLNMLYSDGSGSKLDDLYSSDSREKQRGIHARERRDMTLGRIHRKAVREKDLGALKQLEEMGFTDYGLETRDSRRSRYTEEQHQRQFQGKAAVGIAPEPRGENGNVTGRETEYKAVAADKDGWVDVSGGAPDTITPSQAAAEQRGAVKGSGFAEEEAAKRERGNAEGAFGGNSIKLNKNPSLENPRARFVSKIQELRNKEGGLTESDRKFASVKGKELGLNDDQIYDALDGQSDLTPKAVEQRAGLRKDKDRSAKITSGLLEDGKIIPSPMDINSPFRSNKTGFEFEGDIGPEIASKSPDPERSFKDEFDDLTNVGDKSEASKRKQLKQSAVKSDKSNGFVDSVISDANFVKDVASGVKNQVLDQGIYNLHNAYEFAEKAGAGLPLLPAFLGQALPGETGNYFSRRNKENMIKFHKKTKEIEKKYDFFKGSRDHQASIGGKVDTTDALSQLDKWGGVIQSLNA